MEPKEILEGNRINLIRPTQTFAFAQEFYNLVDNSREYILPWLDWAMPTITKTPEDTYAFIVDANRAWDNKEKYEFSIIEKASNKIAGGIGVMKRGSTADMQFEIGFWLGKDYASKGYMQEAVKLVEEEFFALGVKRLVIRNEIDNIKSRNVGKCLGYEFEGMQRSARYSKYSNKFLDVNVYAKIRSD